MCREAGFVVRTEVMVVDGTRKRMDIVIILPRKCIWIDVSVINPCLPAYAKKNALQIRAGEKIAKWNPHASTRGYEFVPAIFDVFGAVGSQLTIFLTKIAEKARATLPYPIDKSAVAWAGAYRRELVCRLAVALAHGNHLMVEEAIMRARDQPGSTASNFNGLRRSVRSRIR